MPKPTEPIGIDKMELAVIALLRDRSIKRAAAAVGIHPVTLWRWLKLPHFREQLRQAQAQLYSQALARLQQASSIAADALISMLNDRNTPPASRVRIAEFVLEQSKAGAALEDIDFETAESSQVLPSSEAPSLNSPDRNTEHFTPPFVDHDKTTESRTDKEPRRRKPAKRDRTSRQIVAEQDDSEVRLTGTASD